MNKTMEYMAYALPSVSFDLVETRVSGDDAVIYVPSGDVEGFADAVEQLFDDPELRLSMAKRARARVAQQLDWRPQARAYVGVFDELFGQVLRATKDTELLGDADSGAGVDDRGRAFVDLTDAGRVRAVHSGTELAMRTNLHHLLEQAAHHRGESPALDFPRRNGELCRVSGVRRAWPRAVCRRSVWPGTIGSASTWTSGSRPWPRFSARRRRVASSFRSTTFSRLRRSASSCSDCDVRVLVTSQDRLALLRDELKACASLEHVVLVDAHDELPADGDEYQVHAWSDLVAERSDPVARTSRCRQSISTWLRSCTPQAVPASRRALCSATET